VWILRWVFIGVVFLAVLGFSLQNTSAVQIKILSWQSGEIPIYWVVYAAFAAGMGVFFLIAAYHHIRYRVQLRRCQQKIKQLTDELDRLRTVSLEEEINMEDEEGQPPADLGESEREGES